MKVAVGISGGVDSAVAALLLQRQGYELVGVTMTLGRPDEDKSLFEAQEVAKRLNIPLKTVDLAAEWKSTVCDYVKSTYLRGQTPNPCIQCNEFIKFGLLPQAAFALGCEKFATGHYARLEGGKLLRGADKSKDQSYFLYRVKPNILENTLFPLGMLKKSEVKAIGREAGFIAAEKDESQDFCGGDVQSLLGTDPKKGNIINTSGKVLGQHNGFWNYTIGMRKGLGIGGGTPYYVVDLNAERNEVIVAFKEATIKYDLKLILPVGQIDMSLPVKVRSAGEPKLLKDGISGIAPGQSAVFYDGETVVGGGIIS